MYNGEIVGALFVLEKHATKAKINNENLESAYRIRPSYLTQVCFYWFYLITTYHRLEILALVSSTIIKLLLNVN